MKAQQHQEAREPMGAPASPPSQPNGRGDAKPASPNNNEGEALPAETSSEKPRKAELTAAALRINPDIETAGVKRILTRVAVVTKPEPQWWVRVHPDVGFRSEGFGLIDYRQDRRLYIVHPRYSELLKNHYRRHYIFTGITLTGAVFLWVVKMPKEDGAWNQWPASLYDTAGVAMRQWTQVHSAESQYEAFQPDLPKPDPDWVEALHPLTTFDELLDLGFKQTFIDRDDHPVLVNLLGR
jgi:hypothetical protein